MPHIFRLQTGRLAALILVGIVATWAPAAAGDGYYRHGYRYGPGYGYGYPYVDPSVRRDLTRMRETMQFQQRQLSQQIRLQEEQIRLLRQQLSAQHQVTATQACYYRLGAGLETCRDLFDPGSAELEACREKVAQRNSGCSLDAPRPRPDPGG